MVTAADSSWLQLHGVHHSEKIAKLWTFSVRGGRWGSTLISQGWPWWPGWLSWVTSRNASASKNFPWDTFTHRSFLQCTLGVSRDDAGGEVLLPPLLNGQPFPNPPTCLQTSEHSSPTLSAAKEQWWFKKKCFGNHLIFDSFLFHDIVNLNHHRTARVEVSWYVHLDWISNLDNLHSLYSSILAFKK